MTLELTGLKKVRERIKELKRVEATNDPNRDDWNQVEDRLFIACAELDFASNQAKSDLRAIEAELRNAEMKLQYTYQPLTHEEGMVILRRTVMAIHSAIEERKQ